MGSTNQHQASEMISEERIIYICDENGRDYSNRREILLGREDAAGLRSSYRLLSTRCTDITVFLFLQDWTQAFLPASGQ